MKPSIVASVLLFALGACSSAKKTSVPTFTIGGHVGGVHGTVVVANNGNDTLSLSTTGSFTFAKPVAAGGSYAVTVTQQPAGQTCQVGNSSGMGLNANVTDVLVICSANQLQVSGTVVGASGPVTLANGTQVVTVTPPATSFSFGPLELGDNYNIMVQASPTTQVCALGANAVGTMPATNLTDVTLTCNNVPTYALTGAVSGSSSDLIFEYTINSQTFRGALAASASSFSFPGLHQGDSYTIDIFASSLGNTCSFNSPPAGGTVGTSDVSGLDVTCTPNTYAVYGTLGASSTKNTITVSNGSATQTVTNVGDGFSFTGLADGSAVALTATYAGSGSNSGGSCTISPAANFTLASATVTGLQVICP